MLEVTQPGRAPTASDSGTRNQLDILYSPDDFEKSGYPIELKTSRSLVEPHPDRFQDEQSHYFEQLCTYMVLENVLQGYLWIFYINLKDQTGRTFPTPRCYKVTLMEDQFYALEQEILQTRDRLIEAKETMNPRILPLCRPWKCGTSCAYWADRCRPEGRWPETTKKRWTM